MADSTEQDALVKREDGTALPERDPITGRSTSGIMLICALLLIAVLAWALYDEVYGQRPWKSYQREFVERENNYLKRIKKTAGQTEEEVKSSPEYQQLDSEAQAAQAEAEPRKREIDSQVKVIENQLASVTDPFQNQRGQITVLNYRVEQAGSDSAKNKIRQEVARKRAEQVTINYPNDDGTVQKKQLNFPQLETLYNDLKNKKAQLLGERTDLLKPYTDAAKKRDDYLKNHLVGLTPKQIDSLIKRNDDFDFTIKQINVNETNLVDRCETCHLGVREPLELTPANFMTGNKKPDDMARAFVSHPNRQLLQIHNPDRFGCSACHGGNGRATTTVVKAHGLNPFWLHPLYDRQYTEAGCLQCHQNDRVLDYASTLNLGRDLFQNRGCVGCHRYEGFDRETDGLSNTRQLISQLEEQQKANDREALESEEISGRPDTDDETAQRMKAHIEELHVRNSQLAARIDQLNLNSRYLLQDQKKVGPNLKEIRLKLNPNWIPIWLQDPQNFRPGTKMPTFWRFANDHPMRDADGEDQIKAISAYLWQEATDGQVPQQQRGDANRGNELFHQRGCMACHSIDENGQRVGGDFAANLTRVGQKANFDYIVRWIYNPRNRFAPYCPREHRDLTPQDYANHNLPFVFDTEQHSRCPNDGAELQVQNMTVMPNFRLPLQDARDIATYLFSLSQPESYPDASYLNDASLHDRGKALIKQYGCAGCHEIRGFEDEQRIGKELTTEGATPMERLDFAMLTNDAERGVDPLNQNSHEEWYTHQGFFDHKLRDPSIYDRGKEKAPADRLRMPRPYLTDEWRTALTTFLLGSVGAEGASVPQTMFYNPGDRRRDIQEGWWVVKKYNCMGCHSIQAGQKSVLMGLPLYQSSDWQDQLPPRLSSEGARVDPNWLLNFLRDPSLSHGSSVQQQQGGASSSTGGASVANTSAQTNASGGGNQTAGQQASQQSGQTQDRSHGELPTQPGADRNGVRSYLKARMPTFNFSPNELQKLVRFFMAVSSQEDPYIPQQLDPLTDQERLVARQLFTSGTPCLKCHMTGNPQHDATAIAPNFMIAGQRLKPDWTFRWLLDPAQISPGTAMPTGLFRQEGDRWVTNLPNVPQAVHDYTGDHAKLLVRYMMLMTQDEQQRLLSASPAPATGGTAPSPAQGEQQRQQGQTAHGQKRVSRNLAPETRIRHKPNARLMDYSPRAPGVAYAVAHRTG